MSINVVMGVSGCGKTTVAQALAARLGGIFLDADDYHPPANKQKMAAGIPLTDEDRWGWLETLQAELRQGEEKKQTIFLACSALKQVYRDRLTRGLEGVRFIYLRGSKECIRQRLEARSGHFMSAALLDSQWATLEEPAEALVVAIAAPVEEIVATVVSELEGANG